MGHIGLLLLYQGNMENTTKKDERTRNWAFIIYPNEEDECPNNWQEIIESWNTPCLVSPLHDKDINPNGEPKKPHRHCVVMFEGKKSFEQIKALLEPLHAPTPQKCLNVKGNVRYFMHLDNPCKAQYDRKDILAFGGACVDDILSYSTSEKKAIFKDVVMFIQENRVQELSDLVNYCLENEKDDWFDIILTQYTYPIDKLLASNRGMGGRELKQIEREELEKENQVTKEV